MKQNHKRKSLDEMDPLSLITRQEMTQARPVQVRTDVLPDMRKMSATVRELSKLQPIRFYSSILVDWTLIGCFIATAILFPHPLVWLAASLLVATRQHALLVLMHDASHYRLHPNHAINDGISNAFLAYPLFVSTQGYRDNHMRHHFYLNTDDDPDFVRKLGHPEWDFPKTKWQLAKLIVGDMLGRGFRDQLHAITDISKRSNKQRRQGEMFHRNMIRRRIAYYVTFGSLILFSGWALPFLLLWALPAFLFLPALLRIRSIAEHFGLEGNHDLNMSRNYDGPILEQFFFQPHHVGFHLDHHLYPSVPFYNLPRLHLALSSHPIYAQKAHQNSSLFGFSKTTVLYDATARAKVDPEFHSFHDKNSIGGPMVHPLQTAPSQTTFERLDPKRLLGTTRVQKKTIEAHIRRYRYVLPHVRGKNVLDFACGTGYGSAMIKREGMASMVTGADISQAVIDEAQKEYAEPGLQYCRLNADKDPLGNREYDVIVSFETIEHLQHPELFVRKLYKALKPGGILILSAPIHITTDIDVYHTQNFSKKSLAKLVARTGFRLKKMWVDPFVITIPEIIEESKYGNTEPAGVENPIFYYLRHPIIATYRGLQFVIKGGIDLTSAVIVAKKPI